MHAYIFLTSHIFLARQRLEILELVKKKFRTFNEAVNYLKANIPVTTPITIDLINELKGGVSKKKCGNVEQFFQWGGGVFFRSQKCLNFNLGILKLKEGVSQSFKKCLYSNQPSNTIQYKRNASAFWYFLMEVCRFLCLCKGVTFMLTLLNKFFSLQMQISF